MQEGVDILHKSPDEDSLSCCMVGKLARVRCQQTRLTGVATPNFSPVFVMAPQIESISVGAPRRMSWNMDEWLLPFCGLHLQPLVPHLQRVNGCPVPWQPRLLPVPAHPSFCAPPGVAAILHWDAQQRGQRVDGCVDDQFSPHQRIRIVHYLDVETCSL